MSGSSVNRCVVVVKLGILFPKNMCGSDFFVNKSVVCSELMCGVSGFYCGFCVVIFHEVEEEVVVLFCRRFYLPRAGLLEVS